MGVYDPFTDTAKHLFDGTVFNLIPANWTITKLGDTPDGESMRVSRAGITVLFLIHRNGRVGPRDLTKDTIVILNNQLTQFPDAIQSAFWAQEQCPFGRRPALP